MLFYCCDVETGIVYDGNVNCLPSVVVSTNVSVEPSVTDGIVTVLFPCLAVAVCPL